MNWINLIKSLFQKNASGQVCANCWGSQEYGSIQLPAAYDPQIDIKNGNKKHSFIRVFVNRYLTEVTPARKKFD